MNGQYTKASPFFLAILAVALFQSAFLVNATPIENVFINELHYDNSGADTDEFIELTGLAGTELNGWRIDLYNGNSGTSYKSYSFGNWLLADSVAGYGFAAVKIPPIQNGSPDGIVLSDPEGNIIQFLSYEGSFTALSGIAAGLSSEDIGVYEDSDTPLHHSLQLVGEGGHYSSFSWASSQAHTFGFENTGQKLRSAAVQVTEPTALMLFLSNVIFLCFRKVTG